MGPFKKWAFAFIGWVTSNLLWGGVTIAWGKVVGDGSMTIEVTMIGFLVLIVLGFVIFVWLLFRNKPGTVNIVQYEMMARIVAMAFIAQEYGIAPSDLKDLNNPEAMEERAKRIRAERRVSELKKPAKEDDQNLTG